MSYIQQLIEKKSNKMLPIDRSLFSLLLCSDRSVPSGLSLLSNIVTKQSAIWELSIGFVTSLLPNIGFKNKN